MTLSLCVLFERLFLQRLCRVISCQMQASRDVQSRPIKRMCYSKGVSSCEGCFCRPRVRGLAPFHQHRLSRPVKKQPQSSGHQSQASASSFSARDPEEPESGENPLSGTHRPPPVQTSVTCPHFSLPGVARELRPQPGATCPRDLEVAAASALWLETPFLLLCWFWRPLTALGGLTRWEGPRIQQVPRALLAHPGSQIQSSTGISPGVWYRVSTCILFYAFSRFTAPLSGRSSFSS